MENNNLTPEQLEEFNTPYNAYTDIKLTKSEDLEVLTFSYEREHTEEDDTSIEPIWNEEDIRNVVPYHEEIFNYIKQDFMMYSWEILLHFMGIKLKYKPVVYVKGVEKILENNHLIIAGDMNYDFCGTNGVTDNYDDYDKPYVILDYIEEEDRQNVEELSDFELFLVYIILKHYDVMEKALGNHYDMPLVYKLLNKNCSSILKKEL